MNLSNIGNSVQHGVNDIRGAISRAAQRVGVDFTYLLNQAKSESGLDPKAQARTSSAGGLFQFIDQSWLGAVKMYGAKHGLGWAADAIRQRSDGSWKVDHSVREQVMALKIDPDASSLMAAEFASDNALGCSRCSAGNRAPPISISHISWGSTAPPNSCALPMRVQRRAPSRCSPR